MADLFKRGRNGTSALPSRCTFNIILFVRCTLYINCIKIIGYPVVKGLGVEHPVVSDTRFMGHSVVIDSR